jgi:hypothetical protein
MLMGWAGVLLQEILVTPHTRETYVVHTTPSALPQWPSSMPAGSRLRHRTRTPAVAHSLSVGVPGWCFGLGFQPHAEVRTQHPDHGSALLVCSCMWRKHATQCK